MLPLLEALADKSAPQFGELHPDIAVRTKLACSVVRGHLADAAPARSEVNWMNLIRLLEQAITLLQNALDLRSADQLTNGTFDRTLELLLLVAHQKSARLNSDALTHSARRVARERSSGALVTPPAAWGYCC